MKEAFADCKSPGGLTWTFTMTPSKGGVSSDENDSDDLTDERNNKKNKKDEDDEEEDDDEDDKYHKYFGENRRNRYNYRKSYLDASGNKPGVFASSYNLNLSLSDMLSLVGKTITGNKKECSKPSSYENAHPSYYARARARARANDYDDESAYDLPTPNYNSGLLGKMLQDQNNSPAANQGAKYVKYLNGLNPDDYVRKDSIPCYACSL